MWVLWVCRRYTNTHTHVRDQPWHARGLRHGPLSTPRTLVYGHITLTGRALRNDRGRPDRARPFPHAAARTARTRPARFRTHRRHEIRAQRSRPETTRHDPTAVTHTSFGPRHGPHARKLWALAATDSLGPLRACTASTQACSGDATATQRPCKTLAKRRALGAVQGPRR